MKHQSLKYLAIILAVLLHGCREDIPLFPPGDNQLEIEAARSWYDNNKQQLIGLKANVADQDSDADTVPVVYIKPHWGESFYRKNKKFKTVESAIMSMGAINFQTPECRQKYMETEDKRYLQSLTRVVIRTDLETNEKTGFLMTIMPSVDYMEQVGFRPFRNTYLKIDKEFSGDIVYHDLNGQFLDGLRYLDGQITHTVRWMSDPKAPAIVPKAGFYYCRTEYYYGQIVTCTDWYYGSEWGGAWHENYNGTTCDYSWGHIGSAYVCTWIDDGSGGYNIPSPTPTDPIYASGSSLNDTQKQKLNNAITKFKNKYPAYAALYNALVSKGIKISFRIDANINGNAAYATNDRSIRFKNEDAITYENLQEELIHAIQHDQYGSAMTPTIKNYEYEAKVFQDIVCPGECGFIGSMGMDDQFMDDYRDWILDIDSQGGMTTNDYSKFNDFCRQWTGYPGNYDSNFFPKILKSYFN